MANMNKLTIYTDGGARGNPGPAGIGVVIFDSSNKVIKQTQEYIGETTNNQAEYKAVIKGLELARDLKASEIELKLDSELVVSQLREEYKVKNKDLAPLFVKAWNLLQGFDSVKITHVRRDKNHLADTLVNQAIDEAK
jgi:ribonuclease HI